MSRKKSKPDHVMNSERTARARTRGLPEVSVMNSERTRNIPVQEGPLLKVVKPQQDDAYELHISAAHAPNQNPKADDKKITNVDLVSHHPAHHRGGKKVVNTIWRTLEWLTTSALIFAIIFFAMNFSSYSQLIKLKLDKLRGEVQESPFIQQMLQPAAEKPAQKLLPVTATVEQSKKQIPSLALQVAPPDDRIIIPRINKNVPVVKVSTENLIERDWNALEKDIQGALQGGVVHYPGTAQAGDRGNVVITGHSSYFPWDPGRFKDVFALLHEIAVGDTIIVYHNQKQYQYEVYETKVITPDKIEVLTQEGGDRLTLITCTPVGTNLKRLVVLARPIPA